MRIRNISLLGALAIISCAAIAVSHVITSLRLTRANAELSYLRQRLQLIDVADADQVVARRLPSTDNNTQRWAIRLPRTTNKFLNANWGTGTLGDVRKTDAPTIHARAHGGRGHSGNDGYIAFPTQSD